MGIEIKDYSKKLKGRMVLDHVTATFEDGLVHAVVGPNGSGKTMLLRAMCGLIRPTTGSVSVDGHQIEFNGRLPASMGIIIETPGFDNQETALKNLKYLANLNDAFDAAEVERLMAVFGLWQFRNDKVKTYSLGMRQKLAVVQALMEHQRYVLLDEPTNGMDKESVTAFLEEMRHQRELGTTVVIASHHDDELNQIANIMHPIRDGKLEASIKLNGTELSE